MRKKIPELILLIPNLFICSYKYLYENRTADEVLIVNTVINPILAKSLILPEISSTFFYQMLCSSLEKTENYPVNSPYKAIFDYLSFPLFQKKLGKEFMKQLFLKFSSLREIAITETKLLSYFSKKELIDLSQESTLKHCNSPEEGTTSMNQMSL